MMKLRNALIAILALSLVMLAGCKPAGEGMICIPREKALELGLLNETSPEFEEGPIVIVKDESVVPAETEVKKTGEEPEVKEKVKEEVKEEKPAPKKEIPKLTEAEKKGLPVKKFNEGDLVSFPNLAKFDQDGDEIKYNFSSPLNEKGEWKTKAGDAGEYKVTITANDGTLETKQDVVIIIEAENRAPILEMKNKVEVVEGETIKLEPTAYDADGDNVAFSYQGWMTSGTYKTTFEDAGVHTVTVVASDGKVETKKDVLVVVKNINRPPTLETLQNVEVDEGDEVQVNVKANDPDNDELVILYGKPLDEKGKWKTKAGDAGTYTVKVAVSDGEAEVTQEAKITVKSKNLPPKMDKVDDVTVMLKNPEDKQTVKFDPKVSDPDGDKITITYSGWMQTSEKLVDWTVKSGKYTVTITASDGTHKVFQNVSVTINKAPQIII